MVKKRLNKTKRSDIIQLVLGIAAIVLINVISSFVFARFDLTSEKRYTLSPATKKLVENLDDVIYVKIYLEGEFPAGFKRLRSETKEMLDEFRIYSGDNNLQYEFINPSENPDEKVRREVYMQLVKQGLEPTNLKVKEEGGNTQQIIFPGAIFTYHGKSLPLQLLKSRMGASPEEMLNSSIQGLEYEISNTIRKLIDKEKPKIAFIEGHGELDTMNVVDMMRSLSEYYRVDRFAINERLNALDGYKAIVIAKPDSVFSEKDKFVIDQFVMNGGKILWLVETVMASMDSLATNKVTAGLPFSVNLEDMLFRYGVRINTNMVLDLQSAPIPVVTGYLGNQPQQSLFPWYYFPLAISTSTHPIVNNLNAVKFEFANSMDTVGASGVKKTILLHTSKHTKLINAPARVSLAMLEHEPNTAQYNKSFQPLAILLEGKFTSVFKNRLTKDLLNNPDIRYKETSAPTNMIVISDGDVIRNDFQRSKGTVTPLGYDRYTGQEYGNKHFLLNCINYLCDDTGLISVRSRELKLRLLDKSIIKEQKAKWQVINVAAPLVLIILFGIVKNIIRKKKYGSIK